MGSLLFFVICTKLFFCLSIVYCRRMYRKFISQLQKLYTVDLRSIAIMRIAVALVLLTDLAIRSTDMEVFYTDAGALPRSVLYQWCYNPWFTSVHTLFGSYQAEVWLFVAAAVAAICLLIGWQTRVFTIISWFMLMSLQNRNPLIGQGGDDLLRMALFWAIFLPWGRFYSMDSRKKPAPADTRYSGAACLGYMAQVSAVYIFSALLKTSPEWHSQGTALYYALSLDQILMPAGKLIYYHPHLLMFLTHLTLYFEISVPIFVFLPVWNDASRTFAFLGLIAMHIGISLCLFVGLFFLIGMATAIGLIPTPAMDRIESFVRKILKKPKLQPYQAEVLQPDDIAETEEVADENASGARRSKKLLPKSFLESASAFKETILLFLLAYIIIWNYGNLDEAQYEISPKLQWLGYSLRLNQNWGMFAPSVFKDDGWYIFEGTLVNGQKIDLNRNGTKVDYRKPEPVLSLYKNDRWRKYLENYLFVDNSYMRPYYCSYLIKKWNETHAEKLKAMDVVYMEEFSLPDYKKPVPKRVVLSSCH